MGLLTIMLKGMEDPSLAVDGKGRVKVDVGNLEVVVVSVDCDAVASALFYGLSAVTKARRNFFEKPFFDGGKYASCTCCCTH